MNDETKDELMRRTREWLQSCVNAATRSGVPEEADLEAFILAHIDGEPARLAAAREECIAYVRQCGNLKRRSDDSPAEALWEVASALECTDSDGKHLTPLADELRALRAALDEERVKRQEWQVTAHGFEARVAELERENAAWRDTPARILYDNQRKRAEKAEAQVAEAHERLDEFGMRRDGESATLVEGITSMRERIDEYRAEWYRAEAQVAAARQFIEDDTCRHDEEKRAVFRAMDEAAKK